MLRLPVLNGKTRSSEAQLDGGAATAMAIDDDTPIESAHDKAKRIWQNHAVEKSFKEARKTLLDAPPDPPSLQIANTIKSDEFRRKKLEKRANKIRREVLSPIIDDLENQYKGLYETQQAIIHLLKGKLDPNYERRKLLVQKLKLLEELERRRLK
jgi:hypothetical protein